MITVENLSFTYKESKTPAVKSATFQVHPGEIFGFLGPSGAGKSTTQKILIGLLKGYSGTVEVLGKDLRRWGHDYYEKIGVSFELPNHYNKLTALENLKYFRSLYGESTEDPRSLLELVGLQDDGNKRVGQFSKGMRTRLNVVRALLPRPRLLYLDEPTTGLDPVSARRIKDLIRAKRDQGTTVFITTHNMLDAETLCDRVAFIVDGEIRLIDEPRALKLQHGQRTVRVEFQEEGSADAPGSIGHRDFPLEGLGDNGDFLGVIRSHNVQTIHTLETTLESIFIDVTGRRLQ